MLYFFLRINANNIPDMQKVLWDTAPLYQTTTDTPEILTSSAQLHTLRISSNKRPGGHDNSEPHPSVSHAQNMEQSAGRGKNTASFSIGGQFPSTSSGQVQLLTWPATMLAMAATITTTRRVFILRNGKCVWSNWMKQFLITLGAG